MNHFKKLNNWTGWVVFAIASAVYLITMEPTASLWDCSEFIATSYKLEVGHPPGAPLFMMLARFFTMFAPSTEAIPAMVNAMSAIASGFCILFLFWTITHLARRIYTVSGKELTDSAAWTVIGAGVIGALAYTFTDTFWFSAVEGEVYALSSMFTALVVWAMLKWEDVADQPHANRWLILIAYLMGLSIGVHILNLLTIPALVFIYYFRKYDNITLKGVFIAACIAGAILLAINGIIIPYTVAAGAWVDLFCVNVLGLPVNFGITLFVFLLFAILAAAIWFTHKYGKVVLNTIVLALTVILLGYSSYASMTIRACANPPMNSNNPNNPFALLSVLNRDQYGSRPLIYGPYYSTPIIDYKYRNVYYVNDEGKYVKKSVLDNYVYPDQYKHFFPRMWSPLKSSEDYEAWAAYRTRSDFARDDNGEIIRDENGRPVKIDVPDYGRKVVYMGADGQQRSFVEPTFGENLHFFFSYQLNYMYWRYFLWNFVGRQNDIQASKSTLTDGNWLSGIKFIDEIYLGPQDNLPSDIASNKGRNTYYFLPFILGLIGLIYQLNRDPKNFSIVMWLFIMMGIALVIYFNTAPSEPRERDYVYAGSFYAFCIWIGMGVLAVRDLLVRISKRDNRVMAVVATLICAVVPTILAAQNWDDHDRSHRYVARDIGYNYLESTLPNSIILNFGDNDTFPLWYNQEVENVRHDVKVMNMSYLGGEWYIDEMRLRSNDAAPVPFSLPREKYTYTNEVIPIVERFDTPIDIKEAIDFIASENPHSKIQLVDGSYSDYLPSRRLALPVNKENAIASGIVKPEDADLMVDTIYIDISKGKTVIEKSELMFLDLLANFDWKRPLYFTQVYSLQKFGLIEYLQFDGYAYRFVPIRTPLKSRYDIIGRIDTEYAYPLMMNKFRYGNISDPRVYVDYFITYNFNVAHARDSFAALAKQLVKEGDKQRAIEVLDTAVMRMPFSQLRYSEISTIPIIEAYYEAEGCEKGDSILLDYARVLTENIDYYARFEGDKQYQVTPVLDDYLQIYEMLYLTAARYGRRDVVESMNGFYRSIGVEEQDLIKLLPQ